MPVGGAMQARYIPQYIQSDARVFKNCYLNFSYPRPAMRSVVGRASEKAGKDRRKKQAAVTDLSDDSDRGNDSRKKLETMKGK